MTVLELPTPDPRTLDDAARPFAEALADRYAIRRLIGSGGMGMVYLARDKRLDRLVAIKTLPPHLAQDAVVRERFLRETRTAGLMAHPNIVPVFWADEAAGHVYFVMAFVAGESLASRVQESGPMDPRDAVRHLRDVALALGHAHDRGIIHRDIKAENILIDESSGRALVTDFGIAQMAQATPLTVTGQILGSVHYVSPEQVAGGVVDQRSDLYSLGVVGFLALTGQFPFNSEVASAVMLQHVTRAAAPVGTVRRDVPAALAALIDRCLAKDPAHRHDSAHDVVAALDAVEASLNGSAPPRKAVIADAEAQLVWKRAAELQAATGLQPRPPIVPKPRDTHADAIRTSGFSLTDVRLAAVDAGISEQYVEHALGEHGLAEAAGKSIASREAPSPSALASETNAALPSWWAGVPMRVEHVVQVPSELPAQEIPALLHLLRESTGKLGVIGAQSRELAWSSGRFGKRLSVMVVPTSTGTTVHVQRDIRRVVYARTALAVGAGMLVVFPLVTSALLEAIPAGEGLAVMAGFVSGATVTWRAGRALIRHGSERMTARVRDLAEIVAEHVGRTR